jgi:predicted TIM-barrel enzyme
MKHIATKKQIFGMIHLSGSNPVDRALKEIEIFEEEGVHGCIIENYHGSLEEVGETFKHLVDMQPDIKIGVNILPNEFDLA